MNVLVVDHLLKALSCINMCIHSSLDQLCPLCNFDPEISKLPKTCAHITWEDVELQHLYPRAKCYTIGAKVRWRSKVPLQLCDKPGFLSSRLDVRRQTLSLRVCSGKPQTCCKAYRGVIFKIENHAHMIHSGKGSKKRKIPFSWFVGGLYWV